MLKTDNLRLKMAVIIFCIKGNMLSSL